MIYKEFKHHPDSRLRYAYVSPDEFQRFISEYTGHLDVVREGAGPDYDDVYYDRWYTPNMRGTWIAKEFVPADKSKTPAEDWYIVLINYKEALEA